MSAPRTDAQFIDSPPAHTRVLGTPGSGKTTLLVERFHSLKRAGYNPLVIAFGREQREELLASLLPDGTALLGRAPVTTHGLLASNILDHASATRARTLRDVDERVVLDRVIAREAPHLTSDLRAIADSRSFRDALLELLHVLLQNGVSVSTARRAHERTVDRARDVLHLYGAYRSTLTERGLVTFYDAAWAAAARMTADPRVVPYAFDTLLIDDFQDLDPGQFALIQALAPPDGGVAVEVFGDRTGARFGFRGTSDRFFREDFVKAYEPGDVVLGSPGATNPGLRYAITELVAQTSWASTPPQNAATPDLPLFAGAGLAAAGSGRDWHVDASGLEAADEIAEVQQAALIARAWSGEVSPEDIAVIALDAETYRSLLLLAMEERGVRVDVGGACSNATDELIRALVGVLGRDTDGRFEESLLSSPLWPALGAVFGADPVPRLKEAAGARGDGFENLLREHVLVHAHAASTEHVIEEWRRYREVSGLLGGSGSFDEFRVAYLESGAPRAPKPGSVRVLSPREAVGHTFARTLVVGCAEGVLTGNTAREGYLPVGALAHAFTEIDDAASQALALRIDRDASLRSADALLLTALTRARERTVVLSPRRLAGEDVMPAAVVRPLFDESREPAPRVASPAFAAARAIAASQRDGVVSEKAGAVDRAAGWRVAPHPPARRPEVADFWLSPSGMETFSDCARKFLYAKILRLDDPSSIYLTVGTVFHAVMNRLVEPGMNRGAVVASLRSPQATDVIDEAVEKEMTEHGPWVRDLTRTYLANMLARVVEIENSRPLDYTVLSVEQPATLEVDTAKFRGRVDRIDHVQGVGYVVIDYKASGQVKKSASILVDNIEKEGDRGNWQVPLYAAMTGSAGTTPAAFVYFVVPPADESFATGLQLAAGDLPEPIPPKRRPYLRYLPIPAASIGRALDEAFETHAAIAEGRHVFPRTENRETCGRCDFKIACRRSNE